MGATGLLVFASAYAAVVALPGPGITTLVARVLARGTAGVPAFVAGCAAGSLVWLTAAATGLAAAAAAFGGLFAVIRYAGAAYLLLLAWRLWRAPARPMDAGADVAAEEPGRLFLAGLLVNLGNPKAIAFFLALLPVVVDLRGLTLPGFLALAATVAAVIGTVFTAYALVAARARRVFTSPRAVRLLNRGSGVAVAGAATVLALR